MSNLSIYQLFYFFNNYLLDEYFAQASLGFVLIIAVKCINLSVLILFFNNYLLDSYFAQASLVFFL
jgi:hypothetical protein